MESLISCRDDPPSLPPSQHRPSNPNPASLLHQDHLPFVLHKTPITHPAITSVPGVCPIRMSPNPARSSKKTSNQLTDWPPSAFHGGVLASLLRLRGCR